MQQPPRPVDYVLGGTETEQHRLLAQTTGFEHKAAWLLDRLAVRPGWRAIDVGCGPLGVLPALAERVGPRGAVVGLEREARFAEMARAQVAERRLASLPSSTIQQISSTTETSGLSAPMSGGAGTLAAPIAPSTLLTASMLQPIRRRQPVQKMIARPMRAACWPSVQDQPKYWRPISEKPASTRASEITP